ncbi:PIN-like domain-containing protein [Micromonospora chokoriensis]
MTDPQPKASNSEQGIAERFKSWWSAAPEVVNLQDSLIVIDASALLHLYRISPKAREQTLTVMALLQNQLFIPHQAAQEFHRNRFGVATNRIKQFRETRQTLEQAPKEAVAHLRSAVAKFESFRTRIMTERQWKPDDHHLDNNSLTQRLHGVMDAALSEFEALEAEYDLRPGDVLRMDPVLTRLEEITSGRIGLPYDNDQLEQRIREANEFRYPNNIPPGYADARSKSTPYLAAGDYIVWRQIIDQAVEATGGEFVAVVTNDVKEDWWELDKKGRPTKARSELSQELAETCGRQLKLLTLSGFLDIAAVQLPGEVSEETVERVRVSEVETQMDSVIESLRESGHPNLLALSPFELEGLVRALFEAMGYTATLVDYDPELSKTPSPRSYDILAIDPRTEPPTRTIVEVKRYKNMVASETVRALYGSMLHEGADRGAVVTTSQFGIASRDFADGKDIDLIDGMKLLMLLNEHLGIDVTFTHEN